MRGFRSGLDDRETSEDLLPMPEGADRFNAARGLLAALSPG
ncbi:hypothetical protein [Xanthomonas campestris]|nr:hypothetical protein [Xanthomonas campestris]